MKNRQVYLNGVADHVTGNPEYLRRMRSGLDWLRKNSYDPNGIPYSFFESGNPGPEVVYRTSQDLSYSLLGLALYYYLTQDQSVLKDMERIRDYVLKQYVYKSEPQLISWVQTTKKNLSACESHDVGLMRSDSKEIVAILDQVNAYMLLVARTVPPAARADWVSKLHQLAQNLRVRFYNDPATSRADMPPAVPKGFFAGCLLSPGNSSCDFDKGTLHHTDYGHSIKTMWMLYLIGREANDADMISFASTHAPELLARAFMPQGYWAQTDKSISADWDKPVWWIYAELDQAAATFGLKQPDLTKYLNSSYPFWLSNFVDQQHSVHEVWHMRPQDSASSPIPKAHLWKNGFHSFEHALVAFITSAQFQHTPAQLYFALGSTADPARMRPYYFEADQAQVIAKEPLIGDLSDLTKYTVQFSGIH
jgi:mannose/cellobiose epimerase-like protein (N-acyl-D-glucosamine 2-epimerase family)